MNRLKIYDWDMETFTHFTHIAGYKSLEASRTIINKGYRKDKVKEEFEKYKELSCPFSNEIEMFMEALTTIMKLEIMLDCQDWFLYTDFVKKYGKEIHGFIFFNLIFHNRISDIEKIEMQIRDENLYTKYLYIKIWGEESLIASRDFHITKQWW